MKTTPCSAKVCLSQKVVALGVGLRLTSRIKVHFTAAIMSEEHASLQNIIWSATSDYYFNVRSSYLGITASHNVAGGMYS